VGYSAIVKRKKAIATRSNRSRGMKKRRKPKGNRYQRQQTIGQTIGDRPLFNAFNKTLILAIYTKDVILNT
jgi:hypothetical protein